MTFDDMRRGIESLEKTLKRYEAETFNMIAKYNTLDLKHTEALGEIERLKKQLAEMGGKK